MRKTRDLFKKIRDTKGTFHAKMGSIKDRNGMDLTEAEDIQKRWQEYTEELYKKIFTTQRKWQPTPVFLPGESQGQEAWWAAVYGVTQSRTRLK